ncbi:MAG: histidine kinase [Bacteroidota bacterium]
MNQNSILQRRIFGIKVYEYLLVMAFYFFFAYSYHLTLWINRSYEGYEWDDLLSIDVFMGTSGLGYIIKFLLTIPIWWFFFRLLKTKTLLQRLPFHLLTLPLFVFFFMSIYYATSEYLGWGHLEGTGKVWDIYIPSLFYFVQFGIFHAYEYYHSNQRNLKLKAQLKEAALKSELSALKAQLNPHFLYNVFNTISASMPPEQEQSREMIAKLSDLFRYQLKASKTELVSLEEELDFVENYLDLEKARFEDRLQVVIDVPADVRQEQVPPMILQPLVENSIKHGISSLIEGGEITIRVKRKGENIQFEVADTGVGVADKSQLFNVGVGLTNTKLRLEKQYGSILEISDNVPRGLKIEFAL